ncbi:MAG: tRNA (adenosine(37)-N6)-threonylcarbamoyltransferase complex transferase subunit TsaD [Peptococcaceae bacterium]|jgi:N6-L-threonylcarbamoyladenine synthase|nr:tRNA (adenosine(37)-N6)-threonylcarbamoyltransferase complex transferase subunit TsaD [Peptococcaceae bacterium]MBQ2432336.1 tRNA (adenosine(37)-N6)-threonylcarbamoyltransferase complex transferase subunit TsaD [Peptococcaceae bacterium]MBQ5615582.1 tRNA (adenosine(37)-N6)-threonylcarbamoyltransferase complex transferase subunit TsaD [Peptococcaceae bacterium]MBQ5707375.1 tRNA (adenosine(37)-N6)-threonylcarbamoyltransferase complex transferase subunit TsaD [Peptococcaceae bacterium]MBR044895
MTEVITAAEQDTIILAIESSCDETAVAIIKNGHEILANVVSTQIEIHRRYGGVVPEIASRKHLELINAVVQEALDQANMVLDDVTHIAVTYGPGLVGALLVGVATAKALAFASGKPLIGVHHIEGHICANFLVKQDFQFPLVCLVVSGGHTNIIKITDHGQYLLLGQTKDDAAGEAYDKIARAIGLPYPGGPHIEQLSREGNANAIELPRAWMGDDSYDFSFSGLKSAVLNYINKAKMKGEEINPADVAASFQQAVLDVLVQKTVRAAVENGVSNILLAGGVAANGTLRDQLQTAANAHNIQVHYPPVHFCTDNAAMIGAAAHYKAVKGDYADLTLNAVPNLSFEKLLIERGQA